MDDDTNNNNVIIYALKPLDFVLLVLYLVVAVYFLPRKVLRWYQSQKHAHGR